MDHGLGAIAIVGLVLTRDDGVVPAAGILAAAALGYGELVSGRRIAIWCAVLVLAKAGHLGWRWLYYGDLVPNTYYLKLTGVPIGQRLLRGLVTYGGATARQLAPVVIVSVFELAHAAGRKQLLLAAPFAAMSAYSVLVGGDAWEFLNFANRYLTAAVPPLCVLGGLFLGRVHAGRASVRGLLLTLACGLIVGGVWDHAEKIALGYVPLSSHAWGALAIAAGAALAVMALGWNSVLRVAGNAARPSRLAAACVLAVIIAANGRPYAQWVLSNAQLLKEDWRVSAMGLALRETTTPDASIAVYLAGSTPYFARRKAIDLLGKNDRHVARLPGAGTTPGHDRLDLVYSFGLRPDVVVTLSEPGAAVQRVLRQFDYQEVCGAAWVRRDSHAVDRARLARRCVR
jgi:arabinofuranosyltransferase